MVNTEAHGGKIVAAPICPPQIPRDLA